MERESDCEWKEGGLTDDYEVDHNISICAQSCLKHFGSAREKQSVHITFSTVYIHSLRKSAQKTGV